MQRAKVKRRLILKAGTIGLASLLTGCSYEQRVNENAPRYFEEVESVLISADGKKLVVLGEKYHYIFDTPSALGLTLQKAEVKKWVKNLQLSRFYVDDDGTITGNFELSLRGGASDEVRNAALQSGFTDSPNMSVKGKLSGRRYVANGVALPAEQQKLSKKYRILILEHSDAAKLQAAAISPIETTGRGIGIAIVGTTFVLLWALTLGTQQGDGRY